LNEYNERTEVVNIKGRRGQSKDWKIAGWTVYMIEGRRLVWGLGKRGKSEDKLRRPTRRGEAPTGTPRSNDLCFESRKMY